MALKRVVFTQIALSESQIATIDLDGNVWIYTGVPTGPIDPQTKKAPMIFQWRRVPSPQVDDSLPTPTTETI